MFFAAIHSPRLFNWSDFPGDESTREKDFQAEDQDHAEFAAADDGAAQEKPAAAEQQEQNHDEG